MATTVLFNQNGNRSNKNKSEERLCEFVVSCCDTAKMFEFIEETLHQMTLFVQPPITLPRVRIIRFRRYTVIPTAFQNVSPDFRCAISLVAKHNTVNDFHMVKNVCGYFGIMHISRGELQMQRITQSVYNGMNLSGFSTTADSYFLVCFASVSPFFAPAVCWWARILVESILKFS